MGFFCNGDTVDKIQEKTNKKKLVSIFLRVYNRLPMEDKITLTKKLNGKLLRFQQCDGCVDKVE